MSKSLTKTVATTSIPPLTAFFPRPPKPRRPSRIVITPRKDGHYLPIPPLIEESGIAKIPCAYCRATGNGNYRFINRGPETCSVCQGRAYVEMRVPYVACKFCHGLGTSLLTDDRSPCIACEGMAVIHVKPPYEVCPECEGSGRKGRYCPRCRERFQRFGTLPGFRGTGPHCIDLEEDKSYCTTCRGSGLISRQQNLQKSKSPLMTVG